MRREREELVKRVFPQLRKRCEQRGVVWGEVDLRWGVTDEDRAEGRVLPLCLAEIQRCRPYFIGILGERYGWIPDRVSPDVLATEPWISRESAKSVTELEILHGVLNDPAMAGHAYFYFRDPRYLESLPEAERQDGHEDAPHLRARLADLKDRIRASGFPVHEGYPDPEALGAKVLADFAALIDSLYPAGAEGDPLTREAAEHEAFGRHRSRVFVCPAGALAPLDHLLAHGGPPLALTGEPGSGKSAVLANWAAQRREALGPAALWIAHFAGASALSADWVALSRRLIGELARQSSLPLPLPERPEDLPGALERSLFEVCARRPTVLILDGLDQLEDHDGAPDLAFLPRHLPPSLRLVAATLPGRPLAEWRRRGWQETAVPPLAPADRAELVTRYLAQFAKRLGADRVARIAAAPPCANPLYLKTLLDELRQHGEHETLPVRIEELLAARTVPALLALVLGRWERDFARERPHLVRDALRALWAARRGLSEAELLEILGSRAKRLSHAIWTPLALAAEDSLVDRSGLLGFFHDDLRRAVERRYLHRADSRRAAHRRLAAYFAHSPPGDRKLDEMPWQLARSGESGRLRDLLAQPDFLVALDRRRATDARQYWAQLEAAEPGVAVHAYREVIAAPAGHLAAAWPVSTLLADLGHPDAAMAVRDGMIRHFREAADLASLQAALGNQALTYLGRGDWDAASPLLEEQEEICRATGDPFGLQAALGNRALVPMAQGRREEALDLLASQEALCRKLGAKAWLQGCLGNQAVVALEWGDLERAEALLDEQERLCRELDNLDGLRICLGNRALIRQHRGDPSGALGLRREEEALARSLGNRAGLQACLGNQAPILQAQGDLAGALALIEAQERICRELGHRVGLKAALGNRALISQIRGDLDTALALHAEEEQLARDLGSTDGLRVSLGNQALVRLERGEHARALDLVAEQERLARLSGSQDGLRIALDNRGLVLRELGRYEEALACHQDQERICRKVASRAGLAEALGNQGVVLRFLGDLDGSLRLLEEAEAICRDVQEMEGLARTMWQQGLTLRALGCDGEALFALEEASALAARHGLLALERKLAPDLAAARTALGT